MIDSLTPPAERVQMQLSPKELEEKLNEIKRQKDSRVRFKVTELMRDLLSFSLSSDDLCNLLDLTPDIQVLGLVATHPSFDLHAAAHLGRAWSSQGWCLWECEYDSFPEVFSQHKSVFLAYAAASLGSFWYFSECTESTNLEGLGYLAQEELRVRDNEKAFMNLLQSLEEGGFPLLELSITLLRDADIDGIFNQNKDVISLCELAKNI